VSLLQQSNLNASASPHVSSNHVTSQPTSSSGINTISSNSLHVSNPIWLIDFGANEHICSSIHFFSSIYDITPMHVNLPNGQTVSVNKAGTVQFSPHFHMFCFPHNSKLTSFLFLSFLNHYLVLFNSRLMGVLYRI